MPAEFALDARLYRLSEELQPYFTALYSISIDCADDVEVGDYLHPEWAAMRFTQSGSVPITGFTQEEFGPTWPFLATGPTSKALEMVLKRSRIWGLGLQPAGLAKFVGIPASELANRIFNASELDSFSLFQPILDEVRNGSADSDATAQRINGYLMEQNLPPSPGEDMILACQKALRDPEISDVPMLAERLGVGRRTLERLCARYFGFSPKLLLRRQRFLRSLARFMLEPKHNWSKALDVQYFDHAHFVRDFRSFMGMTPTEYAEAPHPILDRMIAQQMADHGAAPETDLPTLVRYASKAETAD